MPTGLLIIVVPSNSCIAEWIKFGWKNQDISEYLDFITDSIQEETDEDLIWTGSSCPETVKIENNKNFKYIIKVADFYYKNTAIMMKKRIINETKIKKFKINKLSSNAFRVYLGPFKDLKSIEKAFNDMVIIDFENLEIIKQWKS